MGKAIRPIVSDIPLLILEVRKQRVILDVDLALLYGVSTKALNQAVRRNQERFPADFLYHLDNKEVTCLRSQIVTSNIGRGGRRYAPLAFTEHGAVMAANILRSPLAIRMSIEIVRAFVRLRQMAMTHRDLGERLDKLEEKYDKQFHVVFDAVRALMEPPEEKPKKPIGFNTELEGSVAQTAIAVVARRVGRRRIVQLG
jgi:hypothetical protein